MRLTNRFRKTGRYTGGAAERDCMVSNDRLRTGQASELYWAAPPADEAAALRAMVDAEIRPVAVQALAKRLGGRPNRLFSPEDVQELDDLVAQCVVSVTAAVQRAKTESSRIENIGGYTWRTSLTSFEAYLRRKKPGYWSVHGSVTDICKHSARTGVTRWDVKAEEVVGYVPWKEKSLEPDPGKVRLLGETLDRGALESLFGETGSRRSELLIYLLDWSTRPLPIGLTTRIMCALLGISDAPEVALDQVERPSSNPSPDVLVGLREYLRFAWSEILQLPVRQRLALLLNFKDRQGANVIALLPLAGIAYHEEIASAFEMSVEELAGIWDGLPMDDETIAGRLSITPLQVSNLRAVARARLQRKMLAAGFQD